MRILILGAGMYVTGRGTAGRGTILPAVAQTSKAIRIDEVVVAAGNPANEGLVSDCTKALNERLGAALASSYRSLDLSKMAAELEALQRQHSFDCAIVSTPDHTHHQILMHLMALGVPTLVVKPFVATLAEAHDVLSAQRERGVYGAVEFHKRFDESNLYAKRAIEERTLGDLLYITVDYSQRVTVPAAAFRAWAHRSNIFQYLAVHYVDLIYFMTGYRPQRLTATATRRKLLADGIDTPDSIHVMMEWQSPTDDADTLVALFNCNWIDPSTSSAMSDQRYKVIGTDGRLECDQKNRGVELVTEAQGVTQVNPYFSDFLYDADGNQTFSGYGFRSIERFLSDVDGLLKGETTVERLTAARPTFQDTLVSVAVTETVNAALEQPAQWFSVPDVDTGSQ